mmetsp:Transcript_163243/g.297762  ORF Transcript_163243/g.297762 Transcript_163243/m.297762 type:complete len:237 (-) Transcript_163243:461-1171(-)
MDFHSSALEQPAARLFAVSLLLPDPACMSVLDIWRSLLRHRQVQAAALALAPRLRVAKHRRQTCPGSSISKVVVVNNLPTDIISDDRFENAQGLIPSHHQGSGLFVRQHHVLRRECFPAHSKATYGAPAKRNRIECVVSGHAICVSKRIKDDVCRCVVALSRITEHDRNCCEQDPASQLHQWWVLHVLGKIGKLRDAVVLVQGRLEKFHCLLLALHCLAAYLDPACLGQDAFHLFT